MLEIKYGINLAIPGGPQFSLSNQPLKIEVYKHFSITLDSTQDEEEITLTEKKDINEAKKLNLLAIKATKTFAKDSLSKLSYKIASREPVDLDDPLLVLGTWVNSIVSAELKINFKLDLKPDNESKDAVTIDIIIGWAEAD